MKTVEQVLQLYRETYFDFNVKHFHEKLQDEHGIQLSYSWVKTALQTAGLVKRRKKPGSPRKRRPRRALPGMMLHIDGGDHHWFSDERRHELIVILEDATSEIYYAQLVEAESTQTVMQALREVVETKGVFRSLYSDRAGHFFVTPKRGERVDTGRPTQVGRALTELSIKMIPAYSPQARGRMERNYGTWQGRLPRSCGYAASGIWTGPIHFCGANTSPSSTTSSPYQQPRKAPPLSACGAKIWIGFSAPSTNAQ